MAFFVGSCCLKDSVKGVLTVAPGGKSLLHRLNNTCRSNNVSHLNGIDGSHHPVASADIYSPSLFLVPRGGLGRQDGDWWFAETAGTE